MVKISNTPQEANPTTDDYLLGNDAAGPTTKRFSLSALINLFGLNPVINFAPPTGQLINGKIVTSVASNDLTVAIKTLAGNDPSSSSPVYVRINNTIRTITAALSVTKNDGTNWFGAGGSQFATLEIDYFVYLGYNTTDAAVSIGFARIPYGRLYSDFSATSTNEKYLAYSGSAPASTDEFDVVGRFNAILSATASFNWSLPATSIIIQKPIYHTRWLTYVVTWAGFSAAPTVSGGHTEYKIDYTTCHVSIEPQTQGTSNATSHTASIPFASIAGKVYDFWARGVDNGGSYSTHLAEWGVGSAVTFYTTVAGGPWTASGGSNSQCNLHYRLV